MTNFHERMLPDMRIEPVTVSIPGGSAYPTELPYPAVFWVKACLESDVNHIMRKPVFGGEQQGKTHTSLLSYKG